MHGSLLHGLKRFVIERDGQRAWEQVVRAAGAGGWYHAARHYDDAELVALVHATAGYEGRSAALVLEDFGAALVPGLLALYGSFVDPQWRTLDLLLHAETVIHKTVRLRDPDADPPQLRTVRRADDVVEILYTSARRLCSVAIGICRGVAAHYQETISVEQPECMHRGDAVCRLLVKVTPPTPGATPADS